MVQLLKKFKLSKRNESTAANASVAALPARIKNLKTLETADLGVSETEINNSGSKEYGWRRKPREETQGQNLISSNIAYVAAALIVMVVGAVFASIVPFGGLGSALVTVTTSVALCGIFALRLFSQNGQSVSKSSTVEAMKERFEFLEDKAWELSESEERYRNIAESFGDMLVMRHFPQSANGVSKNGNIVYCNQEFANCFGKDDKEILGTDFAPVEAEIENAASSKSQGLNQANKTAGATVKAFKTKDGIRWFSWLDLPVRDEKRGGAMILSVARDITDFKNVEKSMGDAKQKAEQANNAKSRFLAMVSHEMRTPLNGILGMSKLLEGTKLTKEQQSYLRSVSTSGTSLLALIEEMLDLTMIEAGKFELKESNFDIREMTNDLIELLSDRAYEKNIGLGVFVSPKIPESIYADRGRLRQILVNLVGNAIKFTSKGGVALHVLLEKNKSGKSQLVFKVIDTGPGLSKKDQLRVFDEFERVDDENNRKVSGAGLGLAISKAIAQQLGGSLQIEKSDSKGSVFSFGFELEISNNGSVANGDHPLNGQNILIIGGNQVETSCLQKQIEAYGAKAVLVQNSAQAFKELTREKPSSKAKHYDAVLLDTSTLKKPDEFIEQAAKHPKDERPHIIIISDPSTRTELDAYLTNGADAYLIRPVREQSLLACLGNEQGSFAKDTPNAEKENNGTNQKSKISNALKGMKILLAEDNLINTKLAKASLEKAGATILHAENGKIAVDIFKKSKVDLILMDMHMPVMDGLEAASIINEIELGNGQSKTIPIIALSADEQKSTRQMASSVGIVEFLSKPMDPINLVEVVSKYKHYPTNN